MKFSLFLFAILFLYLYIPSSYAAINVGKVLFEQHCAICHGKNAQGKVGPNIIGKSIKNIHWALNNVGMMRVLKNKITDKQIKKIADYLHSLLNNASPPTNSSQRLHMGMGMMKGSMHMMQ